MRNRALVLLTLLVIGLLIGCGGSTNATTTTPTVTTGIVSDGYIEGAYVCHDSDNDMQCRDEAIYAVTSTNGSFSLGNFDATQRLLVEVPVGAKDYGPFVNSSLTAPQTIQSALWYFLPANTSSVFVSPFSTLIESIMMQDPTLSLSDAENLLKIRLGFGINSSVSLFDDYLSGTTQNSQLHLLAEVIFSALLENIGDMQNSSALSDQERFWYASQQILNNLPDLLDNLPSSVPTNFDASNYDQWIRFDSSAQTFADELLRIGTRDSVVATDSCQLLSTGIYAFESWKTEGASTDDAYATTSDSDLKTLKIDNANILNLQEVEYSSATIFTTVSDSSSATWVGTPADSYLVDMDNMTRVPLGDIGLFPATKSACQGSRASFSHYNGVLSYDLYLTAQDVGGDLILHHYPELEVELADNLTTPTQTFAMGTQRLNGTVVFTQDMFLLEDDNSNVVANANGNLTTYDFTILPTLGSTFLIDQGGYRLRIINDGTATLQQLSNMNIQNGTWQLVTVGSNQYLQTDLVLDESEIFLVEIGGAVRYGAKQLAGRILSIGQRSDDIMDDVMFNQTAKDQILSIMASGACVPLCAGKTCGSDGCGGTCGTCGVSEGCNLSFQCEAITPTSDLDGDGFSQSTGECNDQDPTIFPGATEIIGDNMDNNCDGNSL
ncbi:MAG: putative metal-binding motif-containing protein [Epsilonproteobacteria bacterium]|nr:putative metal-binding motif-containing protein [Campylobacterota bacterium]